jgi:hypothetical protein
MKAIDTLALIRKQIATLEKRESIVKAKIVSRFGEGYFEGDEFSATIIVADRDNLDMNAVRAKLTPQFIKAHTTTQEVTTVRTAEL